MHTPPRDVARASRALALLSLATALPLAAQAPKQPGPAAATSAAAPAGRAITPRDLWSMGRVAAPAVSPDGRRVAYQVTRWDLESYRSKTEIWVVPVAGGEPVQLMSSATSSSSEPAWSPDGKTLAFTSTRGGNGPQIYLMPLEGGEARALTKEPGGASGPVWSADGQHIAFVSTVWPAGDPQADRLKKLSESKSQAKVYDELMFRHWDAWTTGERRHVFVADVATGATRDLTPGPYDTPPLGLPGFQDYAFSPDGRELAFVRNTDVPTAVGTGNDVWTVPVTGGEAKKLSPGKGNDNSPQYSPDGRYIAWLTMRRPGFEADLAQITLLDRQTGQQRLLAETLDRPVSFFTWSVDSKTIWFLAQDELEQNVYRVPVTGGAATRLTQGSFNGDLALTPDAKTLVVSRSSVQMPVELFALDAAGKTVRQLTHTNQALLAQLALSPVEPFWFEGAAGARVEGFLVKPPDFDPSRKYPVVYLVHGGPQGAWEDSWSYRWNPAMFAAPGYVAVLVNFHGSTGYGQAFTDAISGDWGGAPFQDLMKGLDYALKTYPFLDGTRMVAAGASYGGYMMNWFEGHTDRFRAIINHDGMFNTVSAYASTEELWFPEWEFRGMPWNNRELYEKWNPANFVQNFRTPMLVIHGGLDFRLPLEQGLEAFTTLRRNGIRARLLYFPDEGHWVLKPANAMVWWQTMYEWMAEYLKPAA